MAMELNPLRYSVVLPLRSEIRDFPDPAYYIHRRLMLIFSYRQRSPYLEELTYGYVLLKLPAFFYRRKYPYANGIGIVGYIKPHHKERPVLDLLILVRHDLAPYRHVACLAVYIRYRYGLLRHVAPKYDIRVVRLLGIRPCGIFGLVPGRFIIS